jgi:hypothetical protein
MLKESKLYKTYIRFNKDEKVFEEIVLDRTHQERFERFKSRLEFCVSVGDLVRVRDGSGNLDFDDGKKRFGIDELFKQNPALVIETGLSFITEPMVGIGESSRYVLDLLLLFPEGERVYTSTTFVEPTNDDEWRYYGTTWPKWDRIR